MPLYRTQVALAMASGVNKDRVQNVWHFIADNLTALGTAVTVLQNFYAAVDGAFSNLVTNSGGTIKCYDIADDEPRAPVLEQALGPLSVGGAPLPPEVAFCISFQAPRSSGISQARRRGRIYLGPFASNNMGTDGRPTSALMTQIGGAVQTMVDASEAATTWSWAVYSRVSGVAVSVTDAWIDNEWDTQRRRGREATSRTTFT
jgi:hypothetical protein